MRLFEIEKKEQCSICNESYISCYNLKDKFEISKNYIISNSSYLQELISRFSNYIEKGHKHVEPYLGRYKLILEEYKTAYKYVKYLLNIVKLNPPTYEEIFKKNLEKIKNTINKIEINDYS